jgi:hypothetical protein
MAVDVLAELEAAGAIYTDKHFVYTSGKHGSAYINLDPLFPRVELASELCELLIEPFFGRVDTVVAPATGGIVLAVLSAHATKETLGVPQLEALATVKMEIVPADECKLCVNGVPIVEDIGHGADYKAEHPNYPGGFLNLLASDTGSRPSQ